jgi:hypothetical protein
MFTFLIKLLLIFRYYIVKKLKHKHRSNLMKMAVSLRLSLLLAELLIAPLWNITSITPGFRLYITIITLIIL